MNHSVVWRHRGFTIIEVLIAVVIIGILAAIAIPAYTGFIDRAARADGQAVLLAAAQQLERCYTRTNSYTPCNFQRDSEDGFYSLVGDPNATTYALAAVAQRARPADCRNLTLNHLGVRGPDECWN